MGEIIRFVPKHERERARLVREARAIYDSVFPSVDPVNKSATALIENKVADSSQPFETII